MDRWDVVLDALMAAMVTGRVTLFVLMEEFESRTSKVKLRTNQDGVRNHEIDS